MTTYTANLVDENDLVVVSTTVTLPGSSDPLEEIAESLNTTPEFVEHAIRKLLGFATDDDFSLKLNPVKPTNVFTTRDIKDAL